MGQSPLHQLARCQHLALQTCSVYHITPVIAAAYTWAMELIPAEHLSLKQC